MNTETADWTCKQEDFSPFIAYQIYSAISLHFKTDYDFFKYGYRLKRLTPEAYKGKQYHFEKFHDRFPTAEDFKTAMGVLFYHHNPKWVGEALNFVITPSEKMVRSRAILTAQAYQTTKEVKALLNEVSMQELMSDPAVLCRALYSGKVSPEVLILCDKSFGLLKNVKNSSDFAVKSVVSGLNKLAGFIKTDDATLSAIRSSVRKCIEQSSSV